MKGLCRHFWKREKRIYLSSSFKGTYNGYGYYKRRYVSLYKCIECGKERAKNEMVDFGHIELLDVKKMII